MPDDRPAADQTQLLCRLFLALKDSQLTPHVFDENLQLFNYVASHLSKIGAIRQLEAQKRSDTFIMAFS
jgi:hypothetical protein